METCKPLVSVIVPAYNAERFIVQTLDSILQQTYQDFEVLVVDDGSSDRTADIVQTYASRDPRITLFHQQNAGVAVARNLAIEHAQGEYIAPIDADDIWFPGYLEALVVAIIDPEVGMAYAWSVFIDEDSNLMKICQSSTWQGNDFIPLIYRNLIGNASCVLVRRSLIQQVGGYDPSYHSCQAQGCEDWDLYLRLAQIAEVRVVPRLLVGYRQVVGSMSSDPAPMKRGVNMILNRLMQQHPEIDPIICDWNRSNFAYYLALKCSRNGNHWGTLVYLRQSLKLDYFPLLRLGFYRLGGLAILKIVLSPISSQIWPDHRSWLSFKHDWIAWIHALMPISQELSLASLQQKQVVAQRRFPRYHYERFVEWRCQKIRKAMEKRQSESVDQDLLTI